MELAGTGNKNNASVTEASDLLMDPIIMTVCGFWGALWYQSAFMGPNYTIPVANTHGAQNGVRTASAYGL